MNKLKLLLFCFFVLIPFQVEAGGRGAAAYSGELELVREAMADSLVAYFATMPLAPQAGVRLEALGENKANWLVENSLTKMIVEKGCYAVRASEEADSAVSPSHQYILSYRIADIKFEYNHPRSSIFKKKLVTRRMRLGCFFSLTEVPSPVVVWSKWLQVQRQDLVPADGEETLKNDVFSQRTTLQDKSKWIEILVVMGVISSMVYTLF